MVQLWYLARMGEGNNTITEYGSILVANMQMAIDTLRVLYSDEVCNFRKISFQIFIDEKKENCIRAFDLNHRG